MGIQINGSTDTISAIDGSLSLEGGELRTVSGLNVSGVATATTFIGNLTGNVYAGIVTATSSVVVAAGTTAAPSISPSGDSNTGIFFPSADTIAFGEGGAEAARIDSSGRFGLGTTTVDSPLHVVAANGAPLIKGAASTGTNACYMALENTAGGFIVGRDNSSGGILGGGAYASHLYSQGAYPIVFSTNSTQRAQIDSSGRLLVGTSSTRDNWFNTTSQSPLIQSESASLQNFFSGTYTASGGGAAVLLLGKARGSSYQVVSNGDGLGRFSFQGADGSEMVEAACIIGEVDGTPGANDMPGRLVFSTTADGASSPTERMRITSSGSVQLNGNVDSNARLNLNNVSGGGIALNTDNVNYYGIRIFNSAAGSSQLSISFYGSGGGSIGSISNNNTSVAYNTSSDYRLKENITVVTDGITRLQQLKPSRFNFIADPDKTVDGFIAHEVQAVVPEAINGEKDAVDDEGNPIYQGIDQSKLVPLLTAALQEAIGRIETLEATNASLQTQNDAILARLDAAGI